MFIRDLIVDAILNIALSKNRMAHTAHTIKRALVAPIKLFIIAN